MPSQKHRVPMMEWFFRLAEALTLNLGVKYRYQNTGFYVLKSNSQMAAYMFKCVFTQVHLLSKAYKSDEDDEEVLMEMEEATSKAAFTRQMRLSYALGICLKLIQNIQKEQLECDENKKAKLEARARRLERARKYRNTEERRKTSMIREMYLIV